MFAKLAQLFVVMITFFFVFSTIESSFYQPLCEALTCECDRAYCAPNFEFANLTTMPLLFALLMTISILIVNATHIYSERKNDASTILLYEKVIVACAIVPLAMWLFYLVSLFV